MKTLILGGTFDPVHVGHLFLADETRRLLGYERVIFVPTNLPAHKETERGASAAQRLAMLESAVSGVDGFAVDDCEVLRGGVSYSVETVPELVARHDITGKPGFVIGDDLIAGFARWKEADRLAAMVDLIVAHRSTEKRLEFAYPHRYVENALLPITSTEIRHRIASGMSYRFLVPDAVYKQIEREGLYR